MTDISLINADSRRIPLADDNAQMVITSPPYYNAREEYASWPSYQDYLVDMALVWRECYRVLCDGGRIAVNVPLGYGRPGSGGYVTIGAHISNALILCGFYLRGTIIWYKAVADVGSLLGTAWGTYKSARNPSLRDSYEIIVIAHKGDPSRGPGIDTIDADTFLLATDALWKIPPAPASWHPAPFPAEIPRRLIELYTFAGDIVLDPFSGSATTARVANQLGRVGIGIDLSMDYLRKSDAERINLNDWTRGNGKRVPRLKVSPDLPMFSRSDQ